MSFIFRGGKVILQKIRQTASRYPKTVATAAVATTATTAVFARKLQFLNNQTIQGQDEFSNHIRAQHKKYLLSGMAEPFISQDKELMDLFQNHFSSLNHLLPRDPKQFAEKAALKASVKIRPLSECPVKLKENQDTVIAVGGHPALTSLVGLTTEGLKQIYINDERLWPIANGSAWHIEEDADAEAPTTYRPSQFIPIQIARAIWPKREHSYQHIEASGQFPWRTLDWVGFITNPKQWLPSLRVAWAFQKKTAASQAVREAELMAVAEQCALNEPVYKELNARFGDKLLLSGSGGTIVARTEQEVADLRTQELNLVKENRKLVFLSKEEMAKRGYPLQGLAFAEKTHDRVLSPESKKMMADYIKKTGGEVIDGTVKTIYADKASNNNTIHAEMAGHTQAIVHYQTRDGKDHYTAGQLILSLGKQEILDHNDKTLFDVISATGSSGLAAVFTKPGVSLPRAAVFGGTNHVITVSESPIKVKYENQERLMYVVRFTAGACVGPADRGREATHHDASISLGLVSSLRHVYRDDCLIKPLTVYGCNRVVSQYGQGHCNETYKGVRVLFGFGGGGLTRAPDLVASGRILVKKPNAVTAPLTAAAGTQFKF